MLFTAAKVTHLNALPQGRPERDARTLNMVAVMAGEDFGSYTNHAECEAACPKGIPLEFIAGLNRDVIRAAFRRHREPTRSRSSSSARRGTRPTRMPRRLAAARVTQ
jgi:succinate dehydrogenase / fumarate reductase iron-sulfur subunit